MDEFRAKRTDLGNWPDWCFLPLAGTYAIVSKGKTVRSPNQAQPDARSVTLKWLPPILVNVTGVEDLTTTVRIAPWVTGLDTMKPFYEDIVGLELMRRTDYFALFKIADG